MKKINLKKEEENRIISLFEGGESIRKICKITNYSQSLVQRVLCEKNKTERFKSNKNYIAVCKKTKKQYNDFKNSSGILIKHIQNNYNNIDIPSKFKRKSYEREFNQMWHEKFFKIEEIGEKKEEFKCKFCLWKTNDINNSSGSYTKHLLLNHKINIEKYLSIFPSDDYLFKTFILKEKKIKETNKKNNHVECKICGKKLRYITNTHLKKHNTTPEEYKIKFGNFEYASKSFKNKSKKILKEAQINIKNTYVSKPEKDLKEFIKSLGINFLSNNKSIFNGTEIDIIIPEKNICFEFNGNLYHSEFYGKKDRNYHLNKTILCNSLGYKLIHIMEDEWFLKNDIIKEKIKNILKINDKKSVYARKCTISEISTKEKNTFLNKNHIQGEDKSNIQLGAFYNNKLISVITFSKNIKSNKEKGIYEIKRFASDINLNVVGIFSKFISYFNKNYDFNKLFTFLDIRWNCDKDNNVYAKNGFLYEKTTKPDYTYYNSKISRYKRFHKFGFSKTSIKRRFPDIYSDNKTELEMMRELGYDRIWDCGKHKFYLNL